MKSDVDRGLAHSAVTRAKKKPKVIRKTQEAVGEREASHDRPSTRAARCSSTRRSECVDGLFVQETRHNDLSAIAIAPSLVLFTPMKPAMWTNTHPSMPQRVDSSSSRRPRQSGSSFWRSAKESSVRFTARTRHIASVPSNRTNLKYPSCPRSFSSSKMKSMKGQ